MPKVQESIHDVLIHPLEKILFHAGKGIATAQLELDKNSIATQIFIDNDNDLSQLGIQATWYHFPETALELKMSLSMHELAKKKEGKSISKYRMYGAPMNANYKNSFNYDVAGASLIRAKIVSIPPPTEVE
jgi:hypothetical protein